MKRKMLTLGALIGLALVVLAVLLLLGIGRSSYAAGFVVDSQADAVDANPGDGVCDDGSGNCTLRAAVQETNALPGHDSIDLPAGTYSLSIMGDEDAAASGDLDITDDLTISGAGATTTIIDAGNLSGQPDRVFEVIGPKSVAISGVTIQNGYAHSNYGGGIYGYQGSLALTQVSIRDNRAGIGGGIYSNDLELVDSTVSGNEAQQGGGIFIDAGSALITSSTISDNEAYTSGGGIWGSPGPAVLQIEKSTISGNHAQGGGGIFNVAQMNLVNSTISGNDADEGGGIENYNTFGTALLHLTNCTVSDNVAGGGSDGIWNNDGGVLEVENTIFANSPAGANCLGPITSHGYNLDSDGTCGLSGAGDLTGSPQLGPLQDNGGPTQTHALLEGSPAIDAGDNGSCPPTDQRDVSRPVDGDMDGSAICDIGAFEFLPPPTPTPTPTATPTPAPTPTPTATPHFMGWGQMLYCPHASKWSISVWDGADDTDAQQALDTCGEQTVAAAYQLDPETQAWLRWFAQRPEISNFNALDDMQGVIALGAGAATPTPTATPAPPSPGRIAFESAGDIYVMNPDGTGQVNLTDMPGWDGYPAWSPDGTKIALQSSRDGNDEIYVMNADGTDQTRLTDDPADDQWPTWSADGTKIAFRSLRDGNAEIYVMNADGSDETNLTNDPGPDSDPAWSPDGTKIAFYSGREGNPEIFVMDADGSNPTNVSKSPYQETEPAWSPDGSKIAFQRYEFQEYEGGKSEIYVMDADGTDSTKLTTTGIEAHPTWSPDGFHIAFMSSRDGNNEIYVMNADGTYQTRLTNNTYEDAFPDWSLPGVSSAMVRGASSPLGLDVAQAAQGTMHNCPQPGKWAIAVWSGSDGTDIGQALATCGAGTVAAAYGLDPETQGWLRWFAERPALSNLTTLDEMQGVVTLGAVSALPSAGRIAFVSNRHGSGEIYVMNADGTGQTNLTNSSADDFSPAWSPDGSKIAFASVPLVIGTLTLPEIYVMNADGTAQTNLTNDPIDPFDPAGDPAADLSPTWSPDGSKIAFYSSRGHEIYVVNADGSGLTQLTAGGDGALDLAWSPDGSTIAFAGPFFSFDVIVPPDMDSPLSIVSADGSGQMRITQDAAYDPAWSPDGSQIAFSSNRDGNHEIYVVNADGSGLTNLTKFSPASDSDPAWSPYDSHIAFVSDREGGDDIYVMKADGTNQARLTSDGPHNTSPAWSPDGSQIAFVSDRDGNDEIYVMNADGTGQTRLTNSATDDGEPVWSPAPTSIPVPSDERIAFSSDRDGDSEIYVMNPDGTGPTNLTNTSGAGDERPTWSHGSSQIAFNSDRDGNWEIYVMNADGTGQTNITNDPGYDGEADWSPDDSKIAFTSNRDGNGQIYVMNADGTGQTKLTNDGAANFYAAWSPDGSKIAFTAQRDGNDEIYVMNADGTDQTNLTNNSAGDFHPAWSPDGSKIVFASTRDDNGSGTADIYVMNTDGTGVVRLTNNPATDWLPSWSPDGSKIVFSSDRNGNSEIYVMNADGSGQTNLTNDPAYDSEPDWSPPAQAPIVFTGWVVSGCPQPGEEGACSLEIGVRIEEIIRPEQADLPFTYAPANVVTVNLRDWESGPDLSVGDLVYVGGELRIVSFTHDGSSADWFEFVVLPDGKSGHYIKRL
jgi:CSLREA domain-containing protein